MHALKTLSPVLRSPALVAAGLVWATSVSAMAQEDIATANSGDRNVTPSRTTEGTTGQVLAYSAANGMENEDVQGDSSDGMGNPPKEKWKQGRRYHINGFGNPDRSYQPVWTTGHHTLGDNQYLSIYSHTNHLGADAFGSATVSRGTGPDKTIYVYADVSGYSGRAFSAAIDPMYFTSGDLTITDTLDGLDLSVLGIESEAGYHLEMHSDVPGYESLYRLQILAGADDGLSVVFESNHLLGWDDDDIIQGILDDMIYDGLTYSLESPLSFEFTIPDPGRDFAVDFFSASFAGTIPGPGAGSLLAAGVLVAMRRRCRQLRA